ncbi:MAG: hypothetical protein WKF84_04275 [Pyrinomonadaceae bacterium]
MSSPSNPSHDPGEIRSPVEDLILREDEPRYNSDRERTSSSMRDIASRIPESLSSIGRDISRTIERAISAKDDYVVAVKVSPEAQDKARAISPVRRLSQPRRSGRFFDRRRY